MIRKAKRLWMCWCCSIIIKPGDKYHDYNIYHQGHKRCCLSCASLDECHDEGYEHKPLDPIYWDDGKSSNGL